MIATGFDLALTLPLMDVECVQGATANLADLFKQAANALVGGTKLIQLP